MYLKTPNDVTKNQRSMAKLLKEAGRVKQVLSANTEHHAQVEGLLDDVDFKAKVTRAELEEMCADVFERIGAVVAEALRSSEVTMVCTTAFRFLELSTVCEMIILFRNSRSFQIIYVWLLYYLGMAFPCPIYLLELIWLFLV